MAKLWPVNYNYTVVSSVAKEFATNLKTNTFFCVSLYIFLASQ